MFERERVAMIKLNLGSGPFRLDGWINVDLDAATRPDLIVDLSRDLPFATASIDYIFSEDFIAALTLDGFRHFLAESRRILKPQGAMRVLTPDLARLVRMYLEAPTALVGLWDRTVGVPVTTRSGCEVINLAMELAGRFQYDSETLSALAHDAGFDAVRVDYRQSRFPVLAGLDYREPQESVSMYHELYPRA